MADLSKLILPNNSEYDLKDATARDGLATKQDTLVSGTNIKTINNESLLGSGNITIQGGGSSLPDPTGHEGDILAVNSQESPYWMDTSAASSVDIVTSISSSSTDTTIPSAKAVWDALPTVPVASTTTPSMDGTASYGSGTTWARADHVHPSDTSKQATLVSGTNIKTINNESILGSGNISITPGGVQSVSVTQTLSSGTEVGSISVDGSSTTLYAPTPTSITGGASTIVSSDLTASRALVSNSSGKVAVSDVTSEELGYLDGVTSAIQTQINGKAANSHTHGDITSDGDITATAPTIASGDCLVINDDSASKVTNGPAFGTSTTTYLRNDGQWETPASAVTSVNTQTGAVTLTASNVGAIASPSSPSSGNVLTYNGSSWVAQAPASGLPAQSSSTVGDVLMSDGSDASWVDTTALTTLTIDTAPTPNSGNLVTSGGVYTALQSAGGGLPDQTGHNGDYLTTNGSTASWADVTSISTLTVDGSPVQNSTNLITSGGVYTALQSVDSLPSQTGNSGKYLTTNGSAASWATIDTTSVYLCVYESTTYANALSAYQDGKTLMCGVSDGNGWYYIRPLTRAYSTGFIFGIQIGNQRTTYTLDSSSGWSQTTSTVLPSQSGNSGKYLTTDGTDAYWGTSPATLMNRTTAVTSANTSYTSLITRGEKLLDGTTYDAVTTWSNELVNGAIAWRYE